MLSAGLEAVIHGGWFAGRPDGQWLQALHGVFIVGWLIHGFLLRKRNKHDPR